jgi:hypothetical protein
MTAGPLLDRLGGSKPMEICQILAPVRRQRGDPGGRQASNGAGGQGGLAGSAGSPSGKQW